MKTKFKIIAMALALGALTTVSSCSDDDGAADSDLCFGLTEEQCDELY